MDCASLVPTLIESELFGYVKGAFTGAVRKKQGILAVAGGGTLFLDEIGELALHLQARLLRALEEREIRPVGGTHAIPVNARILAATNRDLEHAAGQGLFRPDLYFRLNVLSLRVPPLRERRLDIPLLVSAFLDRLSAESGKAYEVDNDAMGALVTYDWRGNVRELLHCMERCCVMNSGPVLHRDDLPEYVWRAHRQLGSPSPTGEIVFLEELERRAILDAVTKLDGDKLRAARPLGIGKTTLCRKLREYGATR